MFTEFFYCLRSAGLKVSPDEWLSFMETLDRGMCNSLSAFYSLARMTLVKSEADFIKFDSVFKSYFESIEASPTPFEELMKWVNEEAKKGAGAENPLGKTAKQILDEYERRLKEQTEKHNEGGYFIGQNGYTAFGNAGQFNTGIRVGGRSEYRSAFMVVDDHEFSDFREDTTIGIRQYQMALRRLRQLSAQNEHPRMELDIDKTVADTASSGGLLKIRMKKPRENTIRLLLLMDSGGSMYDHAALCSSLFSAVEKSNSFKDVKIYYFHNCVYSFLYKEPSCSAGSAVPTEDVLRLLDGRYKLLMVGDAAMEINELISPRTEARGNALGRSGRDWLVTLTQRYKRSAWLNPKKHAKGGYYPESEKEIERLIPMYKLTVEGVSEAVRSLIAARAATN